MTKLRQITPQRTPQRTPQDISHASTEPHTKKQLAEQLSGKDPIGKQLRQARETKGLSLQDVSDATHLSVANLVGFENQLYESLPADTFIRGQIAIYGEFLELEGSEVVKAFFAERDSQYSQKKKSGNMHHEHSLQTNKLAEPAHVSPAAGAGILLLLLVVSLTGFCVYTGWSPFAYFLNKEDPSPHTGFVITPDAVEEEAVIPPADEDQQDSTAAVEAETTSYILTALFNIDAEVEVILDDQSVTRIKGISGEEIQWQAEEFIQISFAAPDSATLTINGNPVEFPEEIVAGKPTLTIGTEPTSP